MKSDIHPTYYNKAGVKCSCGNAFSVGSTKEFIETEICSECHPFYTKKEKTLDVLGRVQKFKDRLSKKSDKPKKVKKVKEKKKINPVK